MQNTMSLQSQTHVFPEKNAFKSFIRKVGGAAYMAFSLPMAVTIVTLCLM